LSAADIPKVAARAYLLFILSRLKRKIYVNYLPKEAEDYVLHGFINAFHIRIIAKRELYFIVY
jgi:hypothetical protein